MFLEILQNSQENTCARVSFLIKLQAYTATLLKKRLWHRCFSMKFAKFLRIPFLQNTSGWLLPEIKLSSQKKNHQGKYLNKSLKFYVTRHLISDNQILGKSASNIHSHIIFFSSSTKKSYSLSVNPASKEVSEIRKVSLSRSCNSIDSFETFLPRLYLFQTYTYETLATLQLQLHYQYPQPGL